MSFYEYEHICPECNEEWKEKTLKPRDVFKKKKCYSCKHKSEDEISDMQGLNSQSSCGTCKHFKPIDSTETWGFCEIGMKLANEDDYTLTEAIKNLERCEIDKEEHENFEEDKQGLVHNDCYCQNYEESEGE